MKRNKTVIDIQDDKIYKRVTVKLYGGGTKVRDEVKGTLIATKRQFLVKKGQFLFSKIDARNGAFSVANQEIDMAIVTNDFPVFDIDNIKINSFFFEIITRTMQFADYCQKISNSCYAVCALIFVSSA